MRTTFVVCLMLCSLPWLSSCCCASEPRQAEEEAMADGKEAPLLDRIIAVQSKLHSASGKITYQIVYTKDEDRKPETYQAKLKVQVPDKYHFILAKDDQLEYFISNGEFEWHVEIIDDMKFDSKKELKDGRGKFSGITDYIPLRRESLEKHFKLEAHLEEAKKTKDAKAAYCRIELTPLSEDQKDHMKWTKIYFDKHFKVTSIKMLDANENLYDIKINAMEYNMKFKPETFQYKKDE